MRYLLWIDVNYNSHRYLVQTLIFIEILMYNLEFSIDSLSYTTEVQCNIYAINTASRLPKTKKKLPA